MRTENEQTKQKKEESFTRCREMAEKNSGEQRKRKRELEKNG